MRGKFRHFLTRTLDKMGVLWTVDLWDNSEGDRTKGEEGLRPFEETGWWYRIVQKTQVKRCLHCHNTDRTYGQVLICQSTDTRLRGDDRDTLGTVTLTVKYLRRILTHGQHFPFFTSKEREEGGSDHWETGAWETCDIEVWDKTGDLVFPVTNDKNIVKSVRDSAEGRRTNFIVSPKILRFNRQVLEKKVPEEEPNEWIRTLRELVIQ